MFGSFMLSYVFLSILEGISHNIFGKLKPMYLSRLRVISFVGRNIYSIELLPIVNAPCLEKIDLCTYPYHLASNEITSVWSLRKLASQNLKQIYLRIESLIYIDSNLLE